MRPGNFACNFECDVCLDAIFHRGIYLKPTDKSLEGRSGFVAPRTRKGGAEIVGEIQKFDYGSFGWFMDPDGNKVELWEPSK